MKLKLFVYCVFALFLSTEAIINGQDWLNAPYMVRVQYLQGNVGGQGGGSIISHRHILTSAFVIAPNIGQLAVFLGATTRQAQRQVTVLGRLVHPQYTVSPRTNDIGIITLNLDLVFDRFTQPIALPDAYLAPLIGEQGTALGFGGFPGNNNPNNLAAAFMRVVDANRCNIRHANHPVALQFCAEDMRLRSDICSDDISGPFITLNRGVETLTGIATIHICHVNPNQPSEPSLFTRVSAYRAWIQTNAQV